jgi:hypothetical protein
MEQRTELRSRMRKFYGKSIDFTSNVAWKTGHSFAKKKWIYAYALLSHED